MSVDRTVEIKAADGRITLGELREFIAGLDHAGAADSTVIGARVTMGGALKSLKATAVRFGDGVLGLRGGVS